MGWPYQQKPPMGWPLDYDSGLVPDAGFWLMNEGSGGITQDLSGNRRTGTFTSSSNVTWGSGLSGPVTIFDGTAGQAQIVTTHSAITGQDLSLVVRFRSANTQMSVIFGVGNSSFVMLSETTGKVRFKGTGWNLNILNSSSANTWITAVGTCKGGIEARGYINGLPGLVPLDVAITGITGGNFSYIGAQQASTSNTDGVIDYVLLYNRVLSVPEIVLLYQYPFWMFKDPAEVALLGGYQAAVGGTILPQIVNAYMRVSA